MPHLEIIAMSYIRHTVSIIELPPPQPQKRTVCKYAKVDVGLSTLLCYASRNYNLHKGEKKTTENSFAFFSFQLKKDGWRWEEKMHHLARFTCRCTYPGYGKLSEKEANGFFSSVADCHTTMQCCKRSF